MSTERLDEGGGRSSLGAAEIAAANIGGAELGAASPAGGRRLLVRWLPLIVIVAVSGLVLAMGWHEAFMAWMIANRSAALDFVREHIVIALAAFALANVAVVVFSVPGGVLLTAIGGFLFGTIVGGLVSLFAATAGAVGVFLAARSSLGGTLTQRAGARLERIAVRFRESAFNYLLFLRLVPVLPFWLVNVAPALVRVGLRVFFWATLIGLAPGTFAFAFIGAGLDSVIAAQEAADPDCANGGVCTIDPSALITWELVAALGALAIVAVIPLLLQQWRSRRTRRGHGLEQGIAAVDQTDLRPVE